MASIRQQTYLVVMTVTFSANHYNLLTVGDQEFFLHMVSGQLHLLPNSCPHRGGPLRLGTITAEKIVCPWHGTEVPLSRCQERALPVVYRRHDQSVTVATPAPKHLLWKAKACPGKAVARAPEEPSCIERGRDRPAHK